MTGFVANSAPADEADIRNAPFWPDISPAACREAMRIGTEITPKRLRHSLIDAMLEANQDLLQWQKQQEEQGHDELAAVPVDEIDGESRYLSLYRRAVYSFAKAELTERYRDYDSTLNASQQADKLDNTIDQYRRMAILAIRGILGRSHSTVELI